ncbi:MAG: type II 3-dehydroquinate dehydratase [Gammaproteobacteria bacterium]|nr:type II 3-dehydroquinate dehydratase [Gammaproteobacteria bacterium]MBA3732018.1 type II 3-dehydroquinate dehydratase [Gammaproteobacteria bacterium]
MAKILLLNGPNLNLLGTREPERYGAATLESIGATLRSQAQSTGHVLSALQSNAEHELIERIHLARDDGTAYIIFNPGAFTHTSIALRDALLAAEVPFIEVHITNIHAREPFRRHSYLSDIAVGVIAGLGAKGYELALAAATDALQSIESS